jgi:hypothetical protein
LSCFAFNRDISLPFQGGFVLFRIYSGHLPTIPRGICPVSHLIGTSPYHSMGVVLFRIYSGHLPTIPWGICPVSHLFGTSPYHSMGGLSCFASIRDIFLPFQGGFVLLRIYSGHLPTIPWGICPASHLFGTSVYHSMGGLSCFAPNRDISLPFQGGFVLFRIYSGHLPTIPRGICPASHLFGTSFYYTMGNLSRNLGIMPIYVIQTTFSHRPLTNLY